MLSRNRKCSVSPLESCFQRLFCWASSLHPDSGLDEMFEMKKTWQTIHYHFAINLQIYSIHHHSFYWRVTLPSKACALHVVLDLRFLSSLKYSHHYDTQVPRKRLFDTTSISSAFDQSSLPLSMKSITRLYNPVLTQNILLCNVSPISWSAPVRQAGLLHDFANHKLRSTLLSHLLQPQGCCLSQG